ncbi:hypothetical protein L6060_001138 [Enterococcus faecalis]|nr:hypothetical protein [Enterococcus faecalis]EOI49400.1 hypothetical protein UK1_00882 [Enterococcus faecalis EnGen0301]EPH89047.1 hypothetical protein D921_02786 [Enterococcus faecalis F01966]EGO2849261.1 hypothetical protein [Enterococcus faecalis]EGO5819979.1 hypothetical protein [Enterococcus faecalis]EGO5974477.1 hypothetical protein [Enterococcus faecalis]
MRETVRENLKNRLAGKQLNSFDLNFYEKMGQVPFLNIVFYQLLTIFTTLTEEHLIPIFVNGSHIFIVNEESAKEIAVYEAADLEFSADDCQYILLYQTNHYRLSEELRETKEVFIESIEDLDVHLISLASLPPCSFGKIVNSWSVTFNE